MRAQAVFSNTSAILKLSLLLFVMLTTDHNALG